MHPPKLVLCVKEALEDGDEFLFSYDSPNPWKWEHGAIEKFGDETFVYVGSACGDLTDLPDRVFRIVADGVFNQ